MTFFRRIELHPQPHQRGDGGKERIVRATDTECLAGSSCRRPLQEPTVSILVLPTRGTPESRPAPASLSGAGGPPVRGQLSEGGAIPAMITKPGRAHHRTIPAKVLVCRRQDVEQDP